MDKSMAKNVKWHQNKEGENGVRIIFLKNNSDPIFSSFPNYY